MTAEEMHYFDEGWNAHPDIEQNPYVEGTLAHLWWGNGWMAADDADV